MRAVLMGPPSAGKGTQAARLGTELKVPHISTGDMFRAAIAAGTELGRQARGFMEAGKLVLCLTASHGRFRKLKASVRYLRARA